MKTGRIQASKLCGSFAGYLASQILGHNHAQFFTPDDRKRDLPSGARAIAAHDGWFEAEGWRTRRHGPRLWAHAVLDRILSDDSHILGFAMITRDARARSVLMESRVRSIKGVNHGFRSKAQRFSVSKKL